MNEHDHEQRTVAPDGRADAEQPAWRREFPIDVPQDNYIGRRDFTKYLVLTSLAFAVGQFWIAVQSWLRRREGPSAPKMIAPLTHVPVGGTLSFQYPGHEDPCLLVRPDEQTLLAYGQQCTHLSCAVVPDMKNDCIHCPCHHGKFDLLTGRPVAGPPRRPLSRIHLEIIDGAVYATGVERRTV